MHFTYIKFETDGAIGMITLNHPEKRNALSLALMKELNVLLEDVQDRHDIRVLIIKAQGKVFSSGHNLSEMVNGDVSTYQDIFRTSGKVMQKLQDMPQPVIAQVHGIATAAGCQLVAACDLAVADENASFGTPGVKVGLFCTTPAIPIVRAIGRKRALEMLFTGRIISAKEAEQYGLVNKVVPEERLEAETRALAERIAEASGLTLSIGKRAFYNQINLSDDKAYAYGNDVMVSNLFAQDAAEGIGAFLEKRQPQWKDR
ncbi:MAG TPA: enoyl-CoA hydratase [Nitrospirota bacterium]|nr:enoyl-CoA hydratase [Nitrospirota bacterium]